MSPTRFRLLPVFLIMLLAANVCRSADLKKGKTKSEKPLVLRMWQVPPGFLASCFQPGAKQTPQTYLESMGVTFPPGTFATVQSNWLVVLQTQENINTISSELDADAWHNNYPVIVLEISAYECAADPASESNSSPITWESLKASHPKLTLLDRISCVTKSGQRAVSSQEWGGYKCNLEIEPVISPDFSVADLNIDYHLVMPPQGNSKMEPLELKINTSTTVTNGTPLILKSTAISTHTETGSKIRDIIVVARWEFLTPDGGDFHDYLKSKSPASKK